MRRKVNGSLLARLFTAGGAENHRIRKLAWVIAAGWTIFMLAILVLNLGQVATHINEQARLSLRMTVERDLVFRRWATGHEGVYVEVTPETPPNPYLEIVDERDITSPSGRELTLVNPAYMMRQVYEVGKEYGVYGRIISLDPLSPDNTPDPWEEEALLSFTGDAEEVTTTTEVDGEPTLRLVRPFYTEEGCLACHGHQGYQVGDLQGGISVATSLAPYMAQQSFRQMSMGGGYGLIWLIGLGGIHWASRRLETAVEIQKESEGKYKSLITEMDQGVAVHEMIYDADGNPQDYRFVDVNSGYEKQTGLKGEDIIGKTMLEVLPGTEKNWVERYNQVVTTGTTLQYENHDQESGKYYHVISFRPKPGQFAVISTDITHYKQVEARLIKEEHVMEAILSSMAEKVVFHNPEMKIRWANQAACGFFGLEAEEVVGKNCQEILGRREADCRGCPVKIAIETGQYHQEHLDFPEGKTMLISAYPVWNADGSLDGVVEVSRDVTERARMMAELKRAKEESESASVAKSRFLANMSHEIRTPMNVIIGMANLASEKAANSEEKEYLEMIRESASSLLTLINDILDYSKIEAQGLELARVPINISQEIEKMILTLTPQAHKKGLELTCSVDKSIPRILLGDPARLHQILLNLIGNAIKFTKKGKVAVGVRLEDISGEDGKAQVFFSIKDTGIGIPRDKMGQLFEVFSQVHDSDPYEYEGTGLGLPISKNLVELMGGSLEFESEVNRGSIFYFTIPFAQPEEDMAGKELKMPPSREVPDSKVRGGLDILLVEDKLMNQKLATIYLEKMGHAVTPAFNGKEAVELYKSRQFDLILMDIHMPAMDGYEATSHIRAWEAERGRHTPIIAMTAYAFEEDRDKCLKAGMDDYVSKPVDPAELYSKIYQAVSAREEAAVDREQAKEYEEMLKRLGGNEELLEELVEIFLQDYEEDAARIKECLELKDASTLAFIAHGLKGELGNLGLMSGYKIATELEEKVKEGNFAATAIKLEQLEQAIKRLKKFRGQA